MFQNLAIIYRGRSRGGASATAELPVLVWFVVLLSSVHKRLARGRISAVRNGSVHAMRTWLLDNVRRPTCSCRKTTSSARTVNCETDTRAQGIQAFSPRTFAPFLWYQLTVGVRIRVRVKVRFRNSCLGLSSSNREQGGGMWEGKCHTHSYRESVVPARQVRLDYEQLCLTWNTEASDPLSWFSSVPGAGHLFRYVTNQPPKANSAFHPFGVGKWVPASAGKAKAGMADSVSGWTRGVQVKLWDPMRTGVIPELVKATKRYTNPRLPLPLFTNRKSHTGNGSSIGTNINDLEWPWTA